MRSRFGSCNAAWSSNTSLLVATMYHTASPPSQQPQRRPQLRWSKVKMVSPLGKRSVDQPAACRFIIDSRVHRHCLLEQGVLTAWRSLISGVQFCDLSATTASQAVSQEQNFGAELNALSSSDVPLKIKSMMLYERVERLAFQVAGATLVLRLAETEFLIHFLAMSPLDTPMRGPL
jgi:hypothetical protein